MGVVQVKNVTKSFQRVKALENVSFSLEKGEVVGLLGPNAAGKTTLLRIMSGVSKPDEGDVLVFGHSITAHPRQAKSMLGFLPEGTAVYEKLSVLEYLEFIGGLRNLPVKQVHSVAETLLKRFSLWDSQHTLIEHLSKGQKQKVALIAILLHDPQLLLLDEPMANLDVVAQRIVKTLIQELKREQRVILIASHLLENLSQLCNRIIAINQGRILFDGVLDEFKDVGGGSLEQAYLKVFSTTV